MSTAPSHSANRHDRSHLRLVRPTLKPAHAAHSVRRNRHVTAVDAVAVLAVLYVAVLMMRFLPW